MAGKYATDHADALVDIRDAGADVTFQRLGGGVAVTGAAIRVRGNPDEYEQLSLIEAEAPTLLFAPSIYGDTPALGSVVTWGGSRYTVRSVNPVAPDGVLIIARMVIAR